MSSVKKRKTEGGGAGPALAISAFAARQKLWGAKAREPAAIDPAVEEEETGSVQEALPSRPASSRKRKTRRPDDVLPTPSDDGDTLQRSGTQGQTSPQLSELSSDGVQDAVSSQLESETAQIEAPRRNVLQYSSFKPSQSNCKRTSDGVVALRLQEGERLVILGSYGLKVTEGEVTIAGATIRPLDEEAWVHAPHCHAIPVLRTSKDSMVELRPHPAAASLRNLERLNPVFGRLWNEPPTNEQKGSNRGSKSGGDTFQIIYSSEDGPKKAFLQELSSPAEWNKKLAQIVAAKGRTPPKILLCGPKSSGKSTFAKMLANRLVTARSPPSPPYSNRLVWSGVTILDTDPGQPEYSPPGILSSVFIRKPNLAPPFCHPGAEDRYTNLVSQSVASISPALNPEHFVEVALSLFLGYEAGLDIMPRTPLVINTPGWVQGTGLDILTTLIKRTNPTEVIYMSQDGPEESVEQLKSFCGTIPFTTLPSQASEYTSRTALHYRTMQTMSYFHLKYPPGGIGSTTWDDTPLTEIPPWKVKYRGDKRGLIGVLCYDYQPHPSLLAEAINGMVVALVEIDEASAFKDLLPERTKVVHGEIKTDLRVVKNELITYTPEGIPFIQNLEGKPLWVGASRTIGLALVRGIDVENGELQLLTPVSATELNKFSTAKHIGSRKLVLVAGKFDTPSWAYTEDLYKRSYGNGQSGGASVEVSVADEDTDEDDSEGDHEEEVVPEAREYIQTPWVELLHGNQKRSVGSKVWRVRRDLGKG